VAGVSVRVKRGHSPGLGEDVAVLRFELGKISAAEAELVLVVVSDLSVDIKKQSDQEKEK